MAQDLYHRQFVFAGQPLELVVIRSKRKTLAFHVMPGRRPAEVRVPMKCAWSDIEAFIYDRLEWWHDATKQLETVPMSPRFVNDTRHELFGKLTSLWVTRSQKNRAIFDGEILKIYSKQPDSHEVNQGIFYEFARKESEKLFPARLETCWSQFPIEVFPKGLRIRRMKARWGSCSQTGEICLNSLLVQKSLAAIDLVITHELCHLEHFRHDKAFYALLTQAMPDWREREPMLLPIDRAPQAPPELEGQTSNEPSLNRKVSANQQLNLF